MGRLIKYKPEIFKAEDKEKVEFEGHIEIEMPTLAEIEELCAEVGMYDIDETQLAGMKNGAYMKLLTKAFKIGKERYIKGAEIIRKKDGRKFGLEDLDYIPGLSKLALELGSRFVKGFELGNEPEPQSDLS